MRAILFLSLALTVLASQGAGGELPTGIFLETGAFAGGETDAPLYVESPWRLRLETGYDFKAPERRDWGLGFSLQPAGDDFRLSLMARWRRQLDARWSLQGGLGLLRSMEASVFDTGWEARLGVRHRRHVSVNVIYQQMPYSTDGILEPGGPGHESGTHHALYAGLMFDGEAGLWLGAGTLGVIGVLMLIVLAAGA